MSTLTNQNMNVKESKIQNPLTLTNLNKCKALQYFKVDFLKNPCNLFCFVL